MASCSKALAGRCVLYTSRPRPCYLDGIGTTVSAISTGVSVSERSGEIWLEDGLDSDFSTPGLRPSSRNDGE